MTKGTTQGASAVLTLGLGLAGSAVPAQAETCRILEAHGGAGYFTGTGESWPSLPTIDLAISTCGRWALVVRHVRSLAFDLVDEIDRSGDRTFIGRGELRLTTASVRRRIDLRERFEIDLSVGIRLSASRRSVGLLHVGESVQEVTGVVKTRGGVALEALVGRPMAEHLALRAGVASVLNAEDQHFRVFVLTAWQF